MILPQLCACSGQEHQFPRRRFALSLVHLPCKRTGV
jgi:hypothetical protein